MVYINSLESLQIIKFTVLVILIILQEDIARLWGVVTNNKENVVKTVFSVVKCLSAA